MDRVIETTGALVPYEAPQYDPRTAVHGWLAGYRANTRDGYALELRLFARFLADNGGLGLFEVRRPHVELYARWCETEGSLGRGCKKSTVAHKLAVVSSFYRWCVDEEVLERNPAAKARRPRVDYLSNDLPWLDTNEGARFLAASSRSGDPRERAVCTLLLLNGLRISEALNADIEDLARDRGHTTLAIVRKGDKEATVPLTPPTVRAVYGYIGLDERTRGPIFLGREGGRMGRHAASRIVKRIAKSAGIDKPLSPHGLRRSFITVALDAGVPLRDVQHSAGHENPATTSRYDRNRKSLDRNATFIVSAFLAGGGDS